MTNAEPRYSHKELVRRGKEAYAKICEKVDPGNKGKILAIDVDTGEYELDAHLLAANDRLAARLTDPQIYCLRIGYPTIYRLGYIQLTSV